MRSGGIHASHARCVRIAGVVQKYGQLAVGRTREFETVWRPLEDAISTDVAEEEISRLSALNPERALAAFKRALALQQFQFCVGRKDLIEARIQLDEST